jgi:hypothetical protein
MEHLTVWLCQTSRFRWISFHRKIARTHFGMSLSNRQVRFLSQSLNLLS